MSSRLVTCCGILAVLWLVLFGFSTGEAQPTPLPTVATAMTQIPDLASGAARPIPETVRMDRTGSSPIVLFLHQLHESRQSCKDCHGGKDPLFPKFRSPKGYTMAEMNTGKYCGKCHDGTYAYDVRKRCDLCHYKP